MTPADASIPPIRIECPTCRTSLLVPGQHSVGRFRCPKCDRVFSPPGHDEPAGSTSQSLPTVPGIGHSRLLPPPMPATMKTARPISAREAKSPLEIAADGKLPILLLAEAEQQEKQPSSDILGSPLVLSVVLCVSLLLSVILVLVEIEPATTTDAEGKQEARQVIRTEYFADLGNETPTRQYQVFLREAQRAYARQDFDAERYYYRRVLFLLRGDLGKGGSLTGNPDNDRQLRECIRAIMETE